MSIAEAVALAWASLRSNKMRSFLTLLGVIIGIASVIAILTLGAGLKKQTSEQLAGLGINDLQVRLVGRASGDDADLNSSASYQMVDTFDDSSKITEDIVEHAREYFGPRVAGISLGADTFDSGELTAVSAAGALVGRPQQVTMKSVNADYLELTSDKIAYGRGLTEADVFGTKAVTVIPNVLLTDMFDGDPQKALGSLVEFDGKGSGEFEIVGILAPPEGGLIGSYEEKNFYVPYTAGFEVLGKAPVFDSMTLRAANKDDEAAFAADLQAFLDTTWANDPDVQAKAQDFSNELGQINKVLTTVSMVISFIAGISLLVGGIGIMNIMLVTVTERTREIGVRKALGATRGAIRTQFVVEAMIICFFGGVIGVLLGGIIGTGGGLAMGVLVFPPLLGVVVALAFSIGIGLFFGYYPANKAAKLNPIEALRYE
ncbi:macrolide ABC transporter permease [Corynebacterium sp. 13CS0277]|uniref:ABC transporter permease n=1 Tax=Corynebacterium sp. 13CS0277 TaxID=2071994 RepID=UPI000D03762F|nr:ABC transporter permease [Corynebacterium sp. 13CS0277]PRQ11615.1 macrolide ABC transporter permease [Corynebacterium sp. 13CS0277]